MIRKLIIVLAFVTIGFLSKINAQDSDYLSISGRVRLLAGFELTTPIQAYVIIKSVNKFAITDTLGQFRIDSLLQGTYKLSIQGLGYQNTDTIIKIIKSINDLELLTIVKCEINKDIAQQDIKKNKPRLLLSSGIVPVIYSDQVNFEKKYGVIFFDYGDITPPLECIQQYNKEIFAYLDYKFGKIWRREVSKDLIGL
jgi:hypothetical protein